MMSFMIQKTKGVKKYVQKMKLIVNKIKNACPYVKKTRNIKKENVNQFVKKIKHLSKKVENAKVNVYKGISITKH